MPTNDEAAMQAATDSQAAYDGDSVELFRVVGGDDAWALAECVTKNVPATIEMRGVQSFIESADVARAKADELLSTGAAAAFRVTVPVSAIVASHRVVPALEADTEVQVEGHGTFRVPPENITFKLAPDATAQRTPRYGAASPASA